MSAELTTFRAAAASEATASARGSIPPSSSVERSPDSRAAEEAEYVAARNQLLATIEEARDAASSAWC